MVSHTMQKARLLAVLNGRQWQTRKERRQAAELEARNKARRTEVSAVADFIETDDKARQRAIRLSSGSAYGAQRRSVTFRI